MASVIQLFTKRGDPVASAARSLGAARRRHLRHAARERRRHPARRAGSTTASAPRGSTATTGCRTARSRTPRSAPTSASRWRRPRRCASSAAASSSTSARPGRRRSDGRTSTRSSSATTASPASASISRRTSHVPPARRRTRSRVSSQQSTNLDRRIRRTRATFEGRIGDRSVERLPERHRDRPASGTTPAIRPTGGWRPTRRGNHLLTLLADWDGERATVDESARRAPRPSTRATTSACRLSIRCSGARVSSPSGGRIEHNDNFGTAAVPRATAVFVVRTSRRRRSAKRGQGERRHGHQGADDAGVVQPVAVLPAATPT